MLDVNFRYVGMVFNTMSCGLFGFQPQKESLNWSSTEFTIEPVQLFHLTWDLIDIITHPGAWKYRGTYQKRCVEMFFSYGEK